MTDSGTSSSTTSSTTLSSQASPTATFVHILDVASLLPFNSKEDPNNLAVRWKLWKRSFNLYLVAKGITKDKQKTALLLHTGGLNLKELCYTLLSGTDINPFAESMELLDNYFAQRLNVPFGRHQFRQMEQASGESADQFVCRLRQKAITCEFENVDGAIRDQLIERCKDPRLRRKLLEKVNATLKDLQDLACVQEAVNNGFKAMDQSSAQVNTVSGKPHNKGKKKGQHRHRNRGNRPGKPSGGSQEAKVRGSFRCNYTDHMARDRNCQLIGPQLIGNFAVCCKTKERKPLTRDHEGRNNSRARAYQLSEDSVTGQRDYYAFTIAVGQPTVGSVGGVMLPAVLIDSGTSCNVIDQATWEVLKKKSIQGESRKSSKKLFAYGQKYPIEMIGTFVSEIVCEISGNSCLDEFTVVKGSGRPVLGKNTAEKLGVLRVGPDVCSLTTEGSDADIREKYREIFTGAGKLKDFQLKLHIKSDVTPVAQPVRRLPFGLRAKVDEKLDKYIIEEVSHNLTEWVSPLVVFPKAGGDIRICVDMRRGNSAIERERHPTPTIVEVLYDLNNSTVFSKLDLKWGFHQVELDERSREITTFVTHRGLYRYKRLMFGVTLAPEKYQKLWRMFCMVVREWLIWQMI